MSNVTVTISGLLEDLNSGLKREDIATKYGLPIGDVREIFKHPKLVGKQARKPRGFTLIDDTDDAPEPVASQTPAQEIAESAIPLEVEAPELPLDIPEPEPAPQDKTPQATTQSLI